MTNKGNPSKNWKRLLLFSLLAPWMLSCGALSTPIVTPTVTPTATPTLIPIPTPALPGILDTLKPVLQGHGVPEAGAYDPNSPIPLHIVIVDPTGQGHEYNDHLCFPPKWQPASLADTELVVVLGPEQEVELDTHAYLGGPPITRYRVERTIEIRDARSGSLLWAHTLRGSEPAPFPDMAPVDQTRIAGGHVGFLPVLLHLTGTLCKLPEQCPSAAVFLQPPPLNYDWMMALSPNRQILAVPDRIYETVDEYYTQRSVVHLYQVTNGEVLHDLRHENPTLSRLEFSPDGRFLATESGDRKIWLWQVADGQLLHTLESHRFIAFSPDAQMLATANGDGIELWQVADWKRLRNLPQMGVLSIDSYAAFSPDNQYLMSMTPSDLKLWRLSDGKLLLHFEPSGSDRLDAFTFSPDGEILAGFTGREVRLWQTMNGRLLRTFDLGTGYSEAYRLQFSPNGQFLAIYLRGEFANRGKVQLWRVSDTQLLYALDGNWGIFSSDSQFIAVFDGLHVKILRVADGTLLRSLVRDNAYIVDDRLALFTDKERWMLCPIELWSRAVTR